jgi:hypothetical protein
MPVMNRLEGQSTGLSLSYKKKTLFEMNSAQSDTKIGVFNFEQSAKATQGAVPYKSYYTNPKRCTLYPEKYPEC